MQTDVQHDSSHSSHFSNANLSPVQAQVVEALAEGATVSGAARQADIHRTTIHHWIRNHPEFKAAAEQAQAEYAAALSDEMRELSALAVKTLRNLLERSDVSPAVRLKAALAVLSRPHFPKPGWHLPERIESPKERQITDGLAELKADYDIVRMSEALETNARPAEPAAAAGIPRNSPCPCGSGHKYKRCCSRALAA
jgi:transposase-like protein